MEEKKEKLIVSGNAFYEIDMDCIRKKEAEEKRREEEYKPENIKEN